MRYDIPAILDFLKELKYNNSVEWMHAHQKEYHFARDEFNRMADYIIQQSSLFEPAFERQTAKTIGFRLARDTRFSANKLPYHTHFGIYHTGLGRKVCAAGYFLYFQPDDEDGDYSPVSMIDGGLHKPSCAIQKVIRDAIYHDENDTLQKFLDSEAFRKSGFEFYDKDMFKRPQKQYADYAHPMLVQSKGWSLYQSVSEKELLDENFPERVIESFRIIKPWNDFINEALVDSGVKLTW